MISIKTQPAAQIPSIFGMPVCGHAFGATMPAADVRTAATPAVRDREWTVIDSLGAVKGGTRLAPSNFPGTSAWRPPNC